MKPHLYGDIDNNLKDFPVSVCVLVGDFNMNRPSFKKAQYKVFVQIEPDEITSVARVIEIAPQFDLVLTWNQAILDKCPNAKFFSWGSCWIPASEQKIHKKDKDISIIASEKQYLEGHKLRHVVIEALKGKFDVYGRKYKYVESKTTALNPYRFSVTIENVKHEDYFTEKLIDCLRTGTIPVYWGCPNIDKYFDTTGFVFFKNEEDLAKIIPTLTEEKYKSMMPAIEKNFDAAYEYAESYDDRLHRKISEEIKKKDLTPENFLTRAIKVIKYDVLKK